MEHINFNKNALNRIEIKTETGFVFYDKDAYKDLTNEEGESREPLPEEISYFHYGVYSPDTDFENRIIVVEEKTVPKTQIF